MEDPKKINIPEDQIQICRDLAKVAVEHGLTSFSGKFQPTTGWAGEVSFNWESGRHGEDSNRITIYSNFLIQTKVK